MSIHIAIIDDGINEDYYNIGQLDYNIEITQDLIIQTRYGYDTYENSHGTTCAAIIRKYAKEVSLSSIKILTKGTQKGLKAQLIRALEWCVEQKIHLVNLSAGSVYYKDFKEIEETIQRVTSKGLIIVAACHNQNIFTAPASFKEVIGVKCDLRDIVKAGEYIYNSYIPDGIDCITGSMHRIKNYNGCEEVTSLCNSYAAPYITFAVSEIIKKRPELSLAEIKQELKHSSNKLLIGTDYYKYQQIKYEQKVINCPTINILNISGNNMKDISNSLRALFRRDGYNAISVCSKNTEEDICNGIIPINNFNEDRADIITDRHILNQVYSIYEPDVMIINLQEQYTIEYLSSSMKEFMEYDIRILMIDEVNDTIRKYINPSVNTINIILQSSPREEDFLMKDYKAFCFKDKSVVNKIYDYILRLLDARQI
ncbi:S8 family serine peptidase [Anaerocolumna chitinilytica]|uniref:Peptidase S8/S53 domain-containing protein n=1 Tax=Anaerocolumna chitinilytica TaxID=1727145 RepID=A0A7I8DWY3_9FIRM|nr:S8 family serine peptidase [Anaerocolumna chitinilytica]BCK00797.1 hypothetical protein bsdcttw_38370 [Anaerocolumna chitinilytica]